MLYINIQNNIKTCVALKIIMKVMNISDMKQLQTHPQLVGKLC